MLNVHNCQLCCSLLWKLSKSWITWSYVYCQFLKEKKNGREILRISGMLSQKHVVLTITMIGSIPLKVDYQSSKVSRGGSRISSQGGRPLKKIVPSESRREHFWGISCEKSRFYAKKSYFFQFQEGGRAGCAPPNLKSQICPWKHLII